MHAICGYLIEDGGDERQCTACNARYVEERFDDVAAHQTPARDDDGGSSTRSASPILLNEQVRALNQ